ncbi:MAG: hypothetical protein ACRDS1_05555 [Pseudonocardiaceae bacterium]
MSASAGFEPVAEVTADERARIAFGRAGVRRNDRFLVSTRSTGEILLTPLASIPKRELVVWEDEELRTSLLRGLADVTQGRIARRDDLLDGDDEE